jgi:hypothetical protein
MQSECPRPHNEDVGIMRTPYFLQGVGGVRIVSIPELSTSSGCGSGVAHVDRELRRRTARIFRICYTKKRRVLLPIVNVGSNLFDFVWRTVYDVLRAPYICFRERDNGFHALNSLV